MEVHLLLASLRGRIQYGCKTKKKIRKATSAKAKKKVSKTTKAKTEMVPEITPVEVRRALGKNKKIAEEYASDEEKTTSLLDEAIRKSRRHKGVLAKCWDDLTALIRLVRAYIKGEYRDVSWETIVWAIAAIIYFITPIDPIPDFIPGIGFLDDAAVIALAIASVRKDVDNFREWERSARKKKV